MAQQNMTAVEWFAKEILSYKNPTNISGTDYILIPINKVDFLETKAKQMEKWQRIKFEIPELTDDEIIEASDKSDAENNQAGNYFEYQAGFIHGAKWYREQLKQRQ